MDQYQELSTELRHLLVFPLLTILYMVSFWWIVMVFLIYFRLSSMKSTIFSRFNPYLCIFRLVILKNHIIHLLFIKKLKIIDRLTTYRVYCWYFTINLLYFLSKFSRKHLLYSTKQSYIDFLFNNYLIFLFKYEF